MVFVGKMLVLVRVVSVLTRVVSVLGVVNEMLKKRNIKDRKILTLS